MENCGFGSLATHLENGNRLNESVLKDVVGCCLLGLSYLHDRDVIHGVVDW